MAVKHIFLQQFCGKIKTKVGIFYSMNELGSQAIVELSKSPFRHQACLLKMAAYAVVRGNNWEAGNKP